MTDEHAMEPTAEAQLIGMLESRLAEVMAERDLAKSDLQRVIDRLPDLLVKTQEESSRHVAEVERSVSTVAGLLARAETVLGKDWPVALFIERFRQSGLGDRVVFRANCNQGFWYAITVEPVVTCHLERQQPSIPTS